MREKTDNKATNRVLLILVIGMLAMLGLAYMAYSSARNAAFTQIHGHHLQSVRIFTAAALSRAGADDPGQVLQHLRNSWLQSGDIYADAYLSVMDSRGKSLLLLNGESSLDANSNNSMHFKKPMTVAQLLRDRQDYSGPYLSPRGRRELAAFTFVPSLDAFISIHVPYPIAQDSLYQSGWQWFVVTLFIGVGLMLLTVGLWSRLAGRQQGAAISGHDEQQRQILYKAGTDKIDVQQQADGDHQSRHNNEQHYVSRLRSEKAAVEEASRHKTEFLNRLNHELRTPIHAIIGFTQLLQQTALDDEQIENLREIYTAGQYLQRLVNDVLELSVIESGRMEMSLAPVSIDGLSDECINMLRPLAHARNISFHVQYDEPGGHYVDADRTRLKQVIINLLTNAIKYNEEGGEVFVEVHRYTRRVIYLVRDVGPGLDKQQIDQLFVPLQRAHNEKDYAEGSGLGLAISRALVEQMQGNIKVSSMPGIGSIFQLDFPLSVIRTDNEIVHKNIDIKAFAYRQGQEYTMLYVDDNASNLEIMRQLILSRPELHFVATTDPEQCLHLARAHHADIIVLDLDMHASRVNKLYLQLKSNPATSAVPIVAINADERMTERSGMENIKFRACCTQPLDADDFYQAVDRVLFEASG